MEIRARLGGYYVTGDLPMMRILQARGDLAGALDVLHDLEVVLESAHVLYSGTIALRSAKVLLWLAAGEMARARVCANSCSGGTDLEGLAQAWLLYLEGRCEQAMPLIEARLERAREEGRIGYVVKWLCLFALCLEALGRGEEARAGISEAIMLARPQGFVRSFLDYGAPLENLIRAEVLRDPSVGIVVKTTDRLVERYARELLKAFGEDRRMRRELSAALVAQSKPEILVEPLTDRELEVLTLLAKGLSNKALAERLVVAPSTIKQHLKNIYSKLDVHSRTEAVARAREASLISS
jgi:LuxR family maltose regulon positive regulatory protein